MPDSLRDVLLEFSIAYLSEQPKDVVDYAVEFFTKLQEKRNHSNNMVSVEINSPDEESILSQEDGEWGMGLPLSLEWLLLWTSADKDTPSPRAVEYQSE